MRTDDAEGAAPGIALPDQLAALPRADWAAAFQAMAEHGDDQLIDGEWPDATQWDETEWE